MGWQDREYAKGGSAPGGPSFGQMPGGSGLLIGGSIVTTLIAINAGIFALEAFVPAFKSFTSHGMQKSTPGGAAVFGWCDLVPALVLKGQVWRLITAQYLHAGFMHILFNMFCLHFLGRLIAGRWSPRRFLVVYTICGLAGNAFYVLLSTTGVVFPWTPAVGASGCIYGLLGMVAVWHPNMTIYIMGVLPIRARTLVIVLGLLAVWSVQTRGSNYGGEACHLAGLVFGIWWAARGERWWATTHWAFLPRRRKSPGRPTGPSRFSGSGKDGFAQRLAQRQTDAETIDRILKKVHDGGIHCLSEKEKQALSEATDRERQRETSHERVDRL